MEIITKVDLFIPAHNTSLGEGFNKLKISKGSRVKYEGYGDESQVYSSDPVHANKYSGTTDEGYTFDSKWLYTEPDSIWSFYSVK